MRFSLILFHRIAASLGQNVIVYTLHIQKIKKKQNEMNGRLCWMEPISRLFDMHSYTSKHNRNDINGKWETVSYRCCFCLLKGIRITKDSYISNQTHNKQQNCIRRGVRTVNLYSIYCINVPQFLFISRHYAACNIWDKKNLFFFVLCVCCCWFVYEKEGFIWQCANVQNCLLFG